MFSADVTTSYGYQGYSRGVLSVHFPAAAHLILFQSVENFLIFVGQRASLIMADPHTLDYRYLGVIDFEATCDERRKGEARFGPQVR